MGLTDQLVFPELRADDVEFLQGMNICITFSNSDDEKSHFLLSEFGFRSRKSEVEALARKAPHQQAEIRAQVFNSGIQPVSPLWAATCLLPQVRYLPDLFP